MNFSWKQTVACPPRKGTYDVPDGATRVRLGEHGVMTYLESTGWGYLQSVVIPKPRYHSSLSTEDGSLIAAWVELAQSLLPPSATAAKLHTSGRDGEEGTADSPGEGLSGDSPILL